MNVLLTSHCSVESIGGTQSWVATVGAEMSRRGYLVTTLDSTGQRGRSLSVEHTDRYDLAIVSQNSTFKAARAVSDRVIFVSHGPGELEVPPYGSANRPDLCPNAECFVSEELGAPVIRQPIDTDFWRPYAPTGPPVDVLRVSYYGGMEWLSPLCMQDMGLTFVHISDMSDPKELRGWYNRASVVIASGRSALEAMSCDVPVILADHRPYNGKEPLASSCIPLAMVTNYSCRDGLPITPEGMRTGLSWHLKGGTVGRRDHVMVHHRVEDIVDQLLALVPEAVSA